MLALGSGEQCFGICHVSCIHQLVIMQGHGGEVLKSGTRVPPISWIQDIRSNVPVQDRQEHVYMMRGAKTEDHVWHQHQFTVPSLHEKQAQAGPSALHFACCKSHNQCSPLKIHGEPLCATVTLPNDQAALRQL